ncbi:MAG: hypothetical protein J6P61_00880 [Erysipelotrichaceae bacterium]|nr:hypothetical protein [Erysipelotrichaceae bacterium]
MTREEAMTTGRDLDVYIDSEMADEKTGELDDLWQSIYDIVQVATFGIVEEDPEELKAAIVWLKEVQPMTEAYKTLAIPFEVE